MTSKKKGCFLGGLFGLILFAVLVALSNDGPDFGGLFVFPLFVFFFAIAGTFISWLVGAPATVSRPTRGDFAVWGKGCLMALFLCALILLCLAGVGRYVTTR